MLSMPVTGGRGSGFVALRLGGSLLVRDAQYIVDEFAGLLATPTPYPSAEDCREVRFSLTREDGVDILGPDASVAPQVSEEDKERLSAAYARLRARAKSKKAQRTERMAIRAFRLPDPALERELYRECVDPETGEKRMVVLWGIAKTDVRGRLMAAGPPIPWVASSGPRAGGHVASAPNAVIGGSSEEDEQAEPAQAMPAAYGAAMAGAPGVMPSRCKCWAVGILSLLALGAAVAGGYWWVQQQDEKTKATMDDDREALEGQLDNVSNDLKGLRKEVGGLVRQYGRAEGRDDDDLRRKVDSLIRFKGEVGTGLGDLQAKVKELSAFIETERKGIREAIDTAASGLAKSTDQKVAKLRKDLEAMAERTAAAKVRGLRAAMGDKLARIRKAIADREGDEQVLALLNELGTSTKDKLTLIRKDLQPETDKAALAKLDQFDSDAEATLTLLRKGVADNAGEEKLLAGVDALGTTAKDKLTSILDDLEPKIEEKVLAQIQSLRELTKKEVGLIRAELANKADKDVLAKLKDLESLTDGKLTLLRKALADGVGDKTLLARIDEMTKATEAKLTLIRDDLRAEVDKEVLARVGELSKATDEKVKLLRQAVEAKVGNAELLARINALDKATDDKLVLIRKGLEDKVSRDTLTRISDLERSIKNELDLLSKKVAEADKDVLAKIRDEDLRERLKRLGLSAGEIPKEMRDKLDQVLTELEKLGGSTKDIQAKLAELAATDKRIWDWINWLKQFHLDHTGRATQAEYKMMLDRLRRDGLDIVLVFDSTGSMRREIDQVKAQIQRIGTQLLRLVPSARISVCTYRDTPDRETAGFEFAVKGLPLTNNIRQVSAFLSTISAHGGGDDPEAVRLGLGWAVDPKYNRFNPKARKAILLFGDAQPHDLSICERYARAFHGGNKGQVVSTVTCRGTEKLPSFVSIARAGAGEAFLSADETKIMEQLAILMVGSRYKDYWLKDLGLK